MDNNKKGRFYLIGISIIIFILLIVAIVFTFIDKEQNQKLNNSTSDKKTTPILNLPTPPEIEPDKTEQLTKNSKQINKAELKKSKIDALQQSEEFDITLVDNSLREHFHSLYFKYRDAKDRNEFMDKIRADLLSEFPIETAEKLIKIYETYIDCELSIQEKMLQFEKPETPEDMLNMADEIFAFRKHILGDELAQRLFGEEYNMTSFKIMGSQIYNDNSLYGSEKEAKLRQLAAEIYGDQPDVAISDKTGESLYQEKLLLYKRDFEEMDEIEKKKKIREFREEYLPIEDIENIEAAELEIEANAKRDQNYDESKSAILNDSSLSESDKKAKIYEIQNQIYGSMADEVRRGEEM
ncbi:MAG: hypothetical protein HQK63_08260 [Desulfamplus sp.]|nr:hypothetical protein [Desulfamplus sp.]